MDGEVLGTTVSEMTAEDKAEQNAGYWFKKISKELVGGSSKVALARNYAFLSRDNEIKNALDDKKVQQAKALVEHVVSALTCFIPEARGERLL